MQESNMNSLRYEELLQYSSEVPQYNVFIETGTFQGRAIKNMYDYFNRLYTIELSPLYFEYFNSEKDKHGLFKVKNYFGKSQDLLHEILSEIGTHDSTIFWLDGHWAGGDTARSEVDVPLLMECQIINSNLKANKAIVVVDDYRLFGTDDQFPEWDKISKEKILEKFTAFKIINPIITDDRLFLTIERLL